MTAFGSNIDVDWLCPVNWQHPLNYKLVSWNLVVPGMTGLSSWVDVTDPSNAPRGVLVNMDPSSDWVASSRPGGWGSLDFSEGTEEIASSENESLPIGGSDNFTIAYWINTQSNVSLAQEFGFGNALPGGTNTGQERYTLNFNSNYYFFGDNRDQDSGIAHDTDSLWHHIVWVVDDISIYFYRDGVLRFGPVDHPNFNTAGNLVTFGSQHPSASSSGNFHIDDGRIYARALPADEVQQLFHISSLGYPGVLNRVGFKPYLASVSAVGDITSNIPQESIALTPQTPTTLRSLISNVPLSV